MTGQNPVLVEMNRRNDAFYREKREHLDRRFTGSTLYQLVMADTSAEANRVLKYQKSLEWRLSTRIASSVSHLGGLSRARTSAVPVVDIRAPRAA